MNLYYIAGIALIATPVLVRALVLRGREVSSPEEILAEISNLSCKFTEEDVDIWGLERDSEFWREVHGVSGLLKIRKKAHFLRSFVQSMHLSKYDLDELSFLSQRCYWIDVLVGIQLLILPLSTPHFLARWAFGLYSEMRTRSLTLCCEYNRDLYHSLRASA